MRETSVNVSVNIQLRTPFVMSANEEFFQSLTPERIEVYLVTPDLVTDAGVLDEFISMLSRDEYARLQRFVFASDRKTFLISHALLRMALSRHADVHPASLTFRMNQHGRPEIRGPDAAHGLRFNMSRTKGLVGVAVALQRDIGIDIENVAREPQTDVIESVLSRDEICALRRLPHRYQRKRFFWLWTLKEAYAKARGLGLSLPFCSCTFDLDSGPPIKVVLRSKPYDDPTRWCFELHRPSPIHHLALAYDTSRICKAQVRIVSLPTLSDTEPSASSRQARPPNPMRQGRQRPRFNQ